VPQGERRQAVADQVVWLMDGPHEPHHTEDDDSGTQAPRR
jgi:hypothetical protein